MKNKIIWSEGLFIRPQHFQQNDIYYNYELTTRTLTHGSNMWGFFNLEINLSLLNIGKLSIEKASGILPDGTLFNIDNNDTKITLDINIDHYDKSIYLCLPISYNQDIQITSNEEEEITSRFNAKRVSDILNINIQEDSSCDILISKHNFKLLSEDDLNDGYVKIKVAQINSVSNNGAVSLNENFIATFLHFQNMNSLVSKIEEIVEMITYRSEKLIEKLSNSALQASELGNYLMLQLLNKTQSRLHFLSTQNNIHPQDIFLELTSLAGELAIFLKKEKKLKNQFTYLHLDLSTSFNSIIQELKVMLSTVLEQNASSLKIEKRKYDIYVSKINDKKALDYSTFILIVSASNKQNEIIESIMNNFKIGNVENIRNLVNYNLNGYKLESLATTPREVPYRANHLYFKLYINEDEKNELIKSGGFAFHLSKSLIDVEYELWIVKDSQRESNVK